MVAAFQKVRDKPKISKNSCNIVPTDVQDLIASLGEPLTADSDSPLLSSAADRHRDFGSDVCIFKPTLDSHDTYIDRPSTTRFSLR